MTAHVLLATSSDELEERVRSATNGSLQALPRGPLPADLPHLFAMLKEAPPPEVVVLDPGPATELGLKLAAAFDRHCPNISVVLVAEVGPEITRDAMRAGVRDLLSPEADVAEIRRVLERAYESAKARLATVSHANGSSSMPADKTSRVISVVSPKGGVGKTTVATNLAVGLAKVAPLSTVLVDLDVQFGDVASALSLDPEYTLPDAVEGPASRDSMVLKTFLSQHRTGLYAICGAKTPGAADAITAAHVSHLLQMLAAEFRHVVVDTAPGMNDHTLAAMDQSTDLVLVTSMDVPGIRGLRKELDTLTELGMFPSGRHVVLNLAAANTGLTVADVEHTIGTKVDLVLPRSKMTPASTNQGIPLLQSGVKDPMTSQLRQLVQRLTAPAPANGVPASSSAVANGQTKLPGKPVDPVVKPRRAAKRWRLPRWVKVS
ncbi:MAG: CpaE family protein [Actinomycetes bacterium]